MTLLLCSTDDMRCGTLPQISVARTISEQVYISNKRVVGGTLLKEPHESSYDPLFTVGFCKKIYIFITVDLSTNSFYNA